MLYDNILSNILHHQWYPTFVWPRFPDSHFVSDYTILELADFLCVQIHIKSSLSWRF